MLKLKALVLMSAFVVVGCPTTTMLQNASQGLQPPPKRQQYVSDRDFLKAVAAYQQYLETYRLTLTNKPKEVKGPTCSGVIIAKEFTLPSAPAIVSDDPKEQVYEILDYIDTIRNAVKTHNEVLKKQTDLFTALCPAVDKYIVP